MNMKTYQEFINESNRTLITNKQLIEYVKSLSEISYKDLNKKLPFLSIKQDNYFYQSTNSILDFIKKSFYNYFELNINDNFKTILLNILEEVTIEIEHDKNKKLQEYFLKFKDSDKLKNIDDYLKSHINGKIF